MAFNSPILSTSAIQSRRSRDLALPAGCRSICSLGMEVMKQVQEAIFGGLLEPGDRLPPERELAEQFGLSRMSVRLALHTLESSGLVEIRVGSSGGAFIREPNFDPLRETLASMLRSKKANILELAETRKIYESAIAGLGEERGSK